MGVPTGDPTIEGIGASGGTISTPDGRLTLTVPAGAVSAETQFSLQPITNTALGGVGGAFRVRPEALALQQPVTLVFRGPADYAAGTSIEGLGIAYQDASGFWFPVKEVQRDPVANTLSVTATHFSDWGVVWQAGVPGLYGSFTLDQTFPANVPFSASGNATLFYQGDSSTRTLYILTGSLTPTQITKPGATCTAPVPATQTLPPSVAEMRTSPSAFRWSINGQWSLTCTDASNQTTPDFMAAVFDTLGIGLATVPGCTRGYVGTPTIASDREVGTYSIDCGALGKVTASWDFVACIPGVLCSDPLLNPCHAQATSCDTGVPVCTDTGTAIADGTSCGTDMVCSAGTCTACTAGVACTTNPDPLCHAGATSCATGTSVCVDAAPLANGTSCGSDLVCNAGTCVACTAGAACTANPDPLCHAGTTSCATGSSVCVDAAPLANGTSCGTDMVCNAGTCSACTAGIACTGNPDPLCHAGTTSCATGTSICLDGAPLANGTSCGTDMVCNAGTCSACAAGVICTANPDPLCHAGATSCATGTSVCVDTAPLANGTSCGSGLVCNGGTCVACTAGVACAGNPDPLCHAGTTSCATGTSICVDGAPVANGTSCGTDQVCNAGTCVACAAGVACTTNPDPLCHAGATSCATGTSVCADGAPRANGTSCGTDLVCNAGTCVACTAGLACNTNPDPLCHLGTTSCATGTSVCADGGPRADGTSCGTDLVCNAGACVACTTGAACTTNPDPLCHAGTTSCATGTSVCQDAAPLADGTSCGTYMACSAGACVCTAGAACPPVDACHTGSVTCDVAGPVCTQTVVADGTTCGDGTTCNAGACVSSRTVTGTRNVTYWPDVGPNVARAAPDVMLPVSASVEALVPDGAGGYVTYPGTFAADGSGSFSIPNVPSGTSYFLVLVDGRGAFHAWETTADVVDLGYDVLGRDTVAMPTGTTPVTLELSWLDPWNPAGDELELTASNADVWDAALPGSRPAADLAGLTATPAGTTEDWFASSSGGPLGLVQAGDALYVHHLVTRTALTYTYQAAGAAAGPLTSIAIADGTGGTISAALVAPVATGSVDPDWRVTAFEAFLPSMGPGATADAAPHRLFVGASAHASAAAPSPVAGGSPLLLALTAAPGAADVSGLGALAWNRFLDGALFTEWLEADYVARVSYTLAPASLAFVDTVVVGSRTSFVESVTPTLVQPAFGPVASPLVNGLDALTPRGGVGTTPLLSWAAPAGAAPTSYAVTLYQLGVAVDGITTTRAQVATFTTPAAQLRVPPNLLLANGTYYARIEARVLALDPLTVTGTAPSAAASPSRAGSAWASAGVLTATFTP